MTDIFTQKPKCPHCNSHNVSLASGRKFFITLLGGVLGGLLTSLFITTDKTVDKRASIGSIIFGVFTGGTAGFKYGESYEEFSSEKSYLCINCFKFFTLCPQSPLDSPETREGSIL